MTSSAEELDRLSEETRKNGVSWESLKEKLERRDIVRAREGDSPAREDI